MTSPRRFAKKTTPASAAVRTSMRVSVHLASYETSFGAGTLVAEPHAAMDPLTTAAASGLQARMDSLDMLANNLANTNTSGFKADREFFSTYLSPEIRAGQDPAVAEAPVVKRQWTDFGQGTLIQTGKPTDLALSGTGFFTVNGTNGPMYTRNGNFHLSSQGTLVTAEGYPVRLTSGQSLQVQANDALQIKPDGQVFQNGNALGQLQIVDFKDTSQLTKAAAAYFQNRQPSNITSAQAQVYQGRLETSNAPATEAAAHMVTVLRQFEMLQHAVKVGTEMNREAIEEVARVGS